MKTYATANPAFSRGIYLCEDLINFPGFHGRKRIYYGLVIQIEKTSVYTSLGLVIFSASHAEMVHLHKAACRCATPLERVR